VLVYPLLQATFWQGEIAAVFQLSLLCAACDGLLLHMHARPLLVSPFSLRIQGDVARVRCKAHLMRGMPVREISSVLDIAEHDRVTSNDLSYDQSPLIGASLAEPRGQ
jgi:hypothetical protein